MSRIEVSVLDYAVEETAEVFDVIHFFRFILSPPDSYRDSPKERERKLDSFLFLNCVTILRAKV
jgi:hypothetical protein